MHRDVLSGIDVAFLLALVRTDPARANLIGLQLEHRFGASPVRFRRVASLIRSVHFLTRTVPADELAFYTPVEVLSRLLRGERVRHCSGLFVSPSTIRNNLSEIFRIFDVHSQSELLSLLSH